MEFKLIHLSFLEEVHVFICSFVFACSILTHNLFLRITSKKLRFNFILKQSGINLTRLFLIPSTFILVKIRVSRFKIYYLRIMNSCQST